MNKHCPICGSQTATIAFKNNRICEECLEYIKKSHHFDDKA